MSAVPGDDQGTRADGSPLQLSWLEAKEAWQEAGLKYGFGSAQEQAAAKVYFQVRQQPATAKQPADPAGPSDDADHRVRGRSRLKVVGLVTSVVVIATGSAIAILLVRRHSSLHPGSVTAAVTAPPITDPPNTPAVAKFCADYTTFVNDLQTSGVDSAAVAESQTVSSDAVGAGSFFQRPWQSAITLLNNDGLSYAGTQGFLDAVADECNNVGDAMPVPYPN